MVPPPSSHHRTEQRVTASPRRRWQSMLARGKPVTPRSRRPDPSARVFSRNRVRRRAHPVGLCRPLECVIASPFGPQGILERTIMDETAAGKPPTNLLIIGILAMLWNCVGAYDYLMSTFA